MRIRWVMVLVLALSACDGGPEASVPPATSPTTGASPGGFGSPIPTIASPGISGSPIPTGAGVDLSGVDACALLDEATVRALTGLTDVELRVVDQPQDTQCFWGVTDLDRPQWVEIDVLPRPDGLDPFTLTVGEDCTLVPVAGVGAEASGGMCTDPTRVYLFVWDRGVAVKVLVNEPTGSLRPADLAATALTVLRQLD